MISLVDVIGVVIGIIAAVLYTIEWWKNRHPKRRLDEFDY